MASIQELRSGKKFPYSTFHQLSWVMIVFGICLVGLGCGDVTYSAIVYGSDDCVSKVSHEEYDIDVNKVCKADELVYTYIAAPIWGGIIITITGICGLLINRRQDYEQLMFQKNLFGGMAFFIAALIGPAIFIVAILEAYFQVGIYYVIEDSVTTETFTLDAAKYALPVCVAILGFIAWIFAIVCAFVALNTGSSSYREKIGSGYSDDYNYPAPMMGPQPMMAPQPMIMPPQPVMMGQSGMMMGQQPMMMGQQPMMMGQQPMMMGQPGLMRQPTMMMGGGSAYPTAYSGGSMPFPTRQTTKRMMNPYPTMPALGYM